jgi:hypothetical protein
MKAGRRLSIAILLIAASGMLSPPARAETPYTVTVKLLVDNKEPMVRRMWEKRYRDRMAAASEVFERCCNVQFKIVAVERWTSNDNIRDLNELMNEFEAKVRPEPAQLVIGFTGQYQSLAKDTHMGGARGPFRPHILIREWGRQITEPERLEMLVHELGHYLGAVHSPEPKSVMRPDLSDRQSRARSHKIGFDARNAEAIRIVSDELRKRPIGHLGQLSPEAKARLRPLYQSLFAALPKDPAAPRYLALLDMSLGVPSQSTERLQAVLAGARTVVRAVTDAAADNRLLPEKSKLVVGRVRLSGDELTELYVRRAAAAAQQLPKNSAVASLLLGLGVALDDSPMLPSAPAIGAVWRQIEPASSRPTRIALLGAPTMRGRRDLAQHFAVSAALAVVIGPQTTEAVGIDKEMTDSRGGHGFSFADLSADMAGIQFARAVADGRLSLSRLEKSFRVRDFLPDPGGLKEGIAWDDFVESYGSLHDGRLTRERETLRQQVLALPGYKSTPVETILRK